MRGKDRQAGRSCAVVCHEQKEQKETEFVMTVMQDRGAAGAARGAPAAAAPAAGRGGRRGRRRRGGALAVAAARRHLVRRRRQLRPLAAQRRQPARAHLGAPGARRARGEPRRRERSALQRLSCAGKIAGRGRARGLVLRHLAGSAKCGWAAQRAASRCRPAARSRAPHALQSKCRSAHLSALSPSSSRTNRCLRVTIAQHNA